MKNYKNIKNQNLKLMYRLNKMHQRNVAFSKTLLLLLLLENLSLTNFFFRNSSLSSDFQNYIVDFFF